MNRTAIQNGIDRLYHYGKFDPTYLTTTLTESKVYCSDPASLNDPWDCRPSFAEHSLDEPSVLEDFIRWIFSFTPTRAVTEAELLATQAEMRRNPKYRRGILERFTQDFWKMIPNRWRIYCLTPIPTSTLMWSHYADNHRGICLELETGSRLGDPINPLYGAQEVDYLADYPEWAPHSLSDLGSKALLIKSDEWEYEHEYRIIALAEDVQRPAYAAPMTLKGAFLSLPRGVIKSVIVGCEADYEVVAATIRRADSAMRIRRAVRSPTQYRLQIVD